MRVWAIANQKGGVGKTTSTLCLGRSLADAGKRVLLVSTDPASNLAEMFGVRLSDRPTPIAGVPRLSALNIDPDEAANGYRERVCLGLSPTGRRSAASAAWAVSLYQGLRTAAISP